MAPRSIITAFRIAITADVVSAVLAEQLTCDHPLDHSKAEVDLGLTVNAGGEQNEQDCYRAQET